MVLHQRSLPITAWVPRYDHIYVEKLTFAGVKKVASNHLIFGQAIVCACHMNCTRAILQKTRQSRFMSTFILKN